MLNQTIVIVDDHRLFSSALAELVNKFQRYSVLYEVQNGKELMERMKFPQNVPDIILLDINMPVMDGFETAAWLKKNHPAVRVLALSMNHDEKSIIGMIKAGAHGYVLKDIGPSELESALHHLSDKGTYYSELVTHHLVQALSNESGQTSSRPLMNEREAEFMQYVCSELTYKEIADKMHVSLRSVDGYREALFEKLGVKSRVGLAMYAVKNGIAK